MNTPTDFDAMPVGTVVRGPHGSPPPKNRSDRPVEPSAVSLMVEMFVDDEYGFAAKFSNREILDEYGIYNLHTLAAEVYALGFHDGRGVQADQERREQRRREREMHRSPADEGYGTDRKDTKE